MPSSSRPKSLPTCSHRCPDRRLGVTLLEAVILILGGIAAGFINAVAGGGSAVSIPILTELVGFTVANGTYRIAVLVANIGAVGSFQRGKAVPWGVVRRLVLPASLGAVLGRCSRPVPRPA